MEYVRSPVSMMSVQYCLSVGTRSACCAMIKRNSMDASINRTAAAKKGGMDANPSFMASHVEPQIRQTMIKPPMIWALEIVRGDSDTRSLLHEIEEQA